MRTHSPHRGVTLLELLLAMTVTAIVLAGAIVVVRSQQKAYHDGQRLRGAQGSARRALLALEQALPRAGFGMDAALAFDLSGWYATGPCPAVMGGCPKDSVANSDELVFYARDPRYWVPATNTDDPVGNAWRISSVTSGAVTVNARAGDVFRNGQIFLAVCSGSSSTRTSRRRRPSRRSPPPACRHHARAGRHLEPVPAPGRRGGDRLLHHRRGRRPGAPLPREPLPVPRAPRRGGTSAAPRSTTRSSSSTRASTPTSTATWTRTTSSSSRRGSSRSRSPTASTRARSRRSGRPPGPPSRSRRGPPPPRPPPRTRSRRRSSPARRRRRAQDTAYAPSSFYPYTFGPPPAAERLTNHQANVQAIRVSVLARSPGADIQANDARRRVPPAPEPERAPLVDHRRTPPLGGHDGYQRVVLETVGACRTWPPAR